jgi:spermidine/putrescine transport system ATP-binding protein
MSSCEIEISIVNISKKYHSAVVCDKINLSVLKNELFFILGPSGCGKTTLLRIIAGLLETDCGSVFLNNICLDNLPPYERDINTVFQNYALFPHLNVYNNVAFGLKMRNLSNTDIRNKVTKILSIVDLEGFEKRKPYQLSGGQQQRVALARALVNEPAVLLLDEPLGALDVKLRKQMQLELKHLQKKLEMTFVYVTHDQEEALTMADRIAVMNAGHIEQIGTPDEVYNKPNTRFVAEFVGESNLFESNNLRFNNDSVTLTLDNNLVIHSKITRELNQDQKLILAVRPEKIRLYKEPQPIKKAYNQIEGRIEEILYKGIMLCYVVKINSGQTVKILEQSYNQSAPHQEGGTVYLEWEKENTFIIEE